MNKLRKTLENLFATMSVLLLMWIILSWLNVLCTRPEVPSWNFFKCITTHAETHSLKEQSEIAFHEWWKGTNALKLEPVYDYTLDDVMIMARIIQSEAGADYLPDSTRYGVGSVFFNRLVSDRFPNTAYEVAHQLGQYSPVGSVVWYRQPSDRAIEIATDIYETGGIFPSEVIWQANFRQGKGVYCYDNGIYFCY